MPRTHTVEALILRTYDVGEADRFCVLFTRERGRLTARATAVRKLSSRMGGSVLPFTHLTLQLKESSAGLIISGAMPRETIDIQHNFPTFLKAEQGMELLLALTQDDEPLPELFDLTLAFFRLCGSTHPNLVLGYTFALLYHLGFLPDPEGMTSFAMLSPEEHAFIDAAVTGIETLPVVPDPRRLQAVCDALLRDQLHGPLKSLSVSRGMARQE
jgi:hypothetical protein